jgi:hypothetical protein
VAVTSLSASRQQKTSAAKDHVCHIALNRTLSRKFEKWCKISCHVKATSRKKKPRTKGPAGVHPVNTVYRRDVRIAEEVRASRGPAMVLRYITLHLLGEDTVY